MLTASGRAPAHLLLAPLAQLGLDLLLLLLLLVLQAGRRSRRCSLLLRRLCRRGRRHRPELRRNRRLLCLSVQLEGGQPLAQLLQVFQTQTGAELFHIVGTHRPRRQARLAARLARSAAQPPQPRPLPLQRLLLRLPLPLGLGGCCLLGGRRGRRLLCFPPLLLQLPLPLSLLLGLQARAVQGTLSTTAHDRAGTTGWAPPWLAQLRPKYSSGIGERREACQCKQATSAGSEMGPHLAPLPLQPLLLLAPQDAAEQQGRRSSAVSEAARTGSSVQRLLNRRPGSLGRVQTAKHAASPHRFQQPAHCAAAPRHASLM